MLAQVSFLKVGPALQALSEASHNVAHLCLVRVTSGVGFWVFGLGLKSLGFAV